MGVTAIKYKPRHDHNIGASVKSACQQIVNAINKIEERSPQTEPVIRFWDTINARHVEQKDVRSLISKTKSRVFISGIALNYIAQHCSDELKDVLDRGVTTELVIAANEESVRSQYERYSSCIHENLPLAHKRFL